MMSERTNSDAKKKNDVHRIPPPLSWKQARRELKRTLNNYLQTSIQKVVPSDTNKTYRESTPWFISIWYKWDLDVILGAFGMSIGLLACVIWTFASGETIGDSFLVSQVTGAVLLLVACVVNLWLVVRYRYSTSHGTDTLKRRMVSKFLEELNEQERRCSSDSVAKSYDNGIDLVGTSLTDIYPVYRLSDDIHDYPKGEPCTRDGSWSRVPTLLLVKGDRIALQIGDSVPAKCRILEGKKEASILFPGEEITLEDSYGETVGSVVGKLSRGRTTLPARDSNGLLRLCNDMRIFQVLETPLESFLREPQQESKKPQFFRQLDAVRAILSVVAITAFCFTVAVLLGRYQQFSMDRFHLLPSPFLASIGAFPLIGPGCLILIEALGTARILASYHPVASRTRTMDCYSSGVTSDKDINVDLLILRYFLATLSNRLSLQKIGKKLRRTFDSLFPGQETPTNSQYTAKTSPMVWVPPASLNLLEKLGVATAFTLVDDELVCESQALPQQLLIPSGKGGLKLLDLCPTYEDESDDESDSGGADSSPNDMINYRRSRQRSFDVEENPNRYDFDDSDDSDDNGSMMKDHHHVPSKKKHRRRLLRKAFRASAQKAREAAEEDISGNNDSWYHTIGDHDVQFEDPNWWQNLPSLKCIGLACLLVDEKNKASSSRINKNDTLGGRVQDYQACKMALADQVCKERNSMQLRSLARCIGFSIKPSPSTGPNGDASPFAEKHRLHVINVGEMRERLKIDSHERGSEESRWWGLLRADSTSVIVQDTRSGAYQLLTVGNPQVVTRMCHEAWQGENSTILPLSPFDRSTILETSDSWKLADLDVEAFSYAPIPQNFESRLMATTESTFYLVDNDPRGDTLLPVQRDKGASTEWNLLQNQIFLGILGSLVIPRSETQGLLSTLQDAGVRFVYFSPRNMRRQKEIASQMGIDVAWNCAISLRTLDQGEEDPHRMVSNYADWDVNAKLPHGIDSVRRHLKDVDNVPLLVSLFTDATKDTTTEMINIFQEYHDTVIAVGVSHLPRNSKIFSTADLAIGVDVLSECIGKINQDELQCNALLPAEIIFASGISAHFCAFRLEGIGSVEHMPTILAQGRASLAGATSAAIFFLSGYLSFTFYVSFTVCSVAAIIPYVPTLGSALYLLVILPLVGLPITMTDPDKHCMQKVPPKNDVSISFGKREGKIFFLVSILKALPSAVFPQLLYLIAYGELMIHSEPEIVNLKCISSTTGTENWTSVVLCRDLWDYSGFARDAAVSLSIAELALLTVITSSTFVYRTHPVWEEPPWRRNTLWAISVAFALVLVLIFLVMTLERGTFAMLPWYYSLLAFAIMPLTCLAWDEYLKRHEKTVLDRAEKLRRLQFETRLGMWSPK